ncbi:Flp pilus assembly protein CpaB [Bradyrhizobium sp. G127]|uniref:Flp pilus assembly protein CpaB n=1 Tax=Bradyrhizobium sp. G127 TaxID=2904800 RepID=UPI001F3BD8DC|nr:Flp pilus assembly protein CpaB [Bradyrhizobium sp. G127]MCF2525262.1 Flp pilus assembly protein CpaB [Bradyrhizobium sp. G127]
MNTARIVVLAVAICAGGAAAYLASGSDPVPVAEAPRLETTDVLVARTDIPMGQTVSPGDIQWQSWPSSTASSSFIRRTDRAEAMSQIVGSIARSPFLAGEPIRETKLVKGAGSGFMAAILPTGMRAISTEISPETGAGGFILPNDKVDVILTKREKVPDQSAGTADVINSEIILSNIRVLAIDQTVGEKDGQKVVVGKTATLELKPEQAESLARARQSGTLSLALRSLVDANQPDTSDEGRGKRGSVDIVRYGVPTTMTTRK